MYTVYNKRLRKPKGQSRMDNPVTLEIYNTQDEDRHTTQKTKPYIIGEPF
jgi:hypothetical protein